jgi:inhibitor of KinA sporulation pathway (predicted exonuclease)
MMYADESMLEPQALAVNKKTVEEIQKAPSVRQVWADFTAFIDRFNPRGSPYNAPIMCGYNIDGFDAIIVDRLCKEFGPWDEKRQQQKLFNQFMRYDLARQMWQFNESVEYLPNIKLDTVRQHMGISNVGGHDALQDCRTTAMIVARMFNYNRRLANKFFETSKGCFLENDNTRQSA